MTILAMINLVLSEMQFANTDGSIRDFPLQTCIDHAVLCYSNQQLLPPLRAEIIFFARNFKYSHFTQFAPGIVKILDVKQVWSSFFTRNSHGSSSVLMHLQMNWGRENSEGECKQRRYC